MNLKKHLEGYPEESRYLAEMGMALIGCDQVDAVFDQLGIFLAQVTSNVIIIVNQATPDQQSLITRKIIGLTERFWSQAEKLVRFKIIGKTSPIVEAYRGYFFQTRLQKIPGGFSALAASEIPEVVGKTAEKLFGFHDVYTIGIADGDTIFGNVHIITQQPELSLPIHLIEAFVYQCFLTLSKIKASQDLAASEKQYRLLFQNLTSGFALHEIILNDDGKPYDYRFLQVNPAFEQLTGLKAKDLVGRTVLEVLPDIEPYFIEIYGRVVTTGESIRFENYSQALDRHYEIVAYALEPGQFVTVFENITERKRAEAALQESQRLLDLFFTQSLDGFFFMLLDEPVRWDHTVDKEQVLNYVFTHQHVARINDAMLAQYGATREQFLGLTPNGFFAHDLAHGKTIWRDFFDAGHLHVDTDERKFDGTPMWIEGDYVCLYDAKGYITGHFGVQREVTEQRRIVHAIRDHEYFLAALNDITRAALEIPDLPAMVQMLADRMGELFHADGCYITLWDEQAQATVPAAAYGPLRQTYPRPRSTPGELTMTASVLHAGHPLVAEDVMNTPYISPRIAAKYPTRSLLALPLIVGERKLGAVLVAFNTTHQFTEEEIRRAEQTSRQIALAVAKVRLYQKLQAHAGQLEERVRVRTAELHAQYTQLDAILRSVDDAIFMTDPEWRIRYANSTFTTLTGYPSDQVINQGVCALNMTQNCIASMQSISKALVQDKLWQGEVIFRRKNGQAYDAALAVAPTHDTTGQTTGYVFSHQDISQSKDLERARNEFITNVSHQFRTPVTTLKLNVYLMLRDAVTEKQRNHLERLEAHINWLIQLIEDTLTLTALDSGNVIKTWAWVSFVGILDEIVTRYQKQARESEVALISLPVPPDFPKIKGDVALLTQALGELIENALTFTPSGGKVQVAVRLITNPDGDWVTVAVQDTGPGIPPEEQEKVFGRFYRGSLAESGNIPGSGLGLSIVEKIMEAHGGRVTVESVVGEGSTFTLWLRSSMKDAEDG